MSLALLLTSLADDIGAFLAEETRPHVLRELPDSITADELEAETKSWILEYLTSKYGFILFNQEWLLLKKFTYPKLFYLTRIFIILV